MERDRKILSNDTYWICPLYFFECDTKSNNIDLGEGTSIWRIPDTLRDEIDKITHGRLELNLIPVQWVIRFTKPKNIPHASRGIFGDTFDVSEELSRIAIDITTSLRLQHKGDVVPGPIIHFHAEDNGCSEMATYPFDYSSEATNYFSLDLDTYVLSKTEVQTFIDFWRDFNTKRVNKKLNDIDIGLGRFNSSYTEGLEDKLIDHMIALESLYLGDDKELNYKLALRAAFLLGEDTSAERSKIFKRLKEAYDARSKIVHGGKTPKNLAELTADTEEYVRQSLRRFIQLSDRYSQSQLTKQKGDRQAAPLLDQNILENGELLNS